MENKKREYVFVVCGLKEHINTLHTSINYLSSFSSNKINVITDTSRNEIPIKHQQIIDVRTPEYLSHHQASIYLKTGLYQFLPVGPTYCYLDSDVLAVSNRCDQIFEEYKPPITFAPDHCKMDAFSPFAINCGCFEKCEDDRNRFNESLKKNDRSDLVVDPSLKKQSKEIEEVYEKINKNPALKLLYAIKYLISYPKFSLNEKYHFDKRKRFWLNDKNEIIRYELDSKAIAKETGLIHTLWSNKWKNKEGEDIFDLNCHHLKEAIHSTFSIKIKNPNWQHWNGGVFLFDEESHAFLKEWQSKCLQIFDLKEWKTRDQGTLIATAWEFGLENHPTLSKEWNFIADYHNRALLLNAETNELTDDGFKTAYKPNFIHLFHEWGNTDWVIWNWATSSLSQLKTD